MTNKTKGKAVSGLLHKKCLFKMKKIFWRLGVAILLLLSGRLYAGEISVKIQQPLLPVVTNKTANPVIRIDLIAGKTGSYSLEKVRLSLGGDRVLDDVESVSLYKAVPNGMIDTTSLLCGPVPAATSLSFDREFKIEEDTFSCWISVKLKETADIRDFIQVKCTEIVTDRGRIAIPEEAVPKALRLGVAVRRHQQDGVHTSRIPGLATTKNGTLLAIYDARWESARDLQGNIDIALNRSTDGGRTWNPMQIILDRKEWGGLPEKYNGVSDPCVLVDERTGAIYVAGLWMYGVLDKETGKWVEHLTQDSVRWQHQWQAKGSQPGYGVKETCQFLLTKSTDDGLTWSEPENLTSIKKKEWWLFAPAPGHGITLKDGTLVFPTQGRDAKGEPFSNITWSKDHGQTWTTSNPAYSGTTECMAVELSGGAVMLNMRDNRNRGNAENNGRRICVTSDLGKTWTEHPTSRKALIEPTCMGSIHRHVYKENGVEKSLLLFVNPNSISKRDHITLKVSFDDGKTWPEDHWILLDEYSGRGYSCITSVDEKTIGILYESSQADLIFQQIELDELINIIH